MVDLKKGTIEKIRLISLYGIAATLAFSVLNLNSIFLILFAFTWIIEGGFAEKWRRLKSNGLFIAFSLYFIIVVLGLFNANSFNTGWKHFESNVGLLVLPMLFCSIPFSKRESNQVLLALIIFLTLASLYCLAMAGATYGNSRKLEVFFYHDLVKPIGHHAVYFSVFMMAGVAFLLKEANQFAWLKDRKWLKISWILYCVAILVLLSSKMVLVFLLGYFLYRLYRSFRSTVWQKVAAVCLAALIIILLFTTKNPVRERFADIFKPNTELLKEKFNTGTYFNGVEFRLLLWRITYEILGENKAWILGVGPTNAQQYLNQKYLELDLYSGDDGKRDAGYLVYNCHNQFLQTTLQSGLLGLAALLFLCAALITEAIRARSELAISILLLIFCFFLIESVLERQYGILLCAWLPFLLFMRANPATHKEVNRKTS